MPEKDDSSIASAPALALAPALATSTSSKPNLSRAEQQMKKLKDANSKYKDLLKLAKERIQTQEEELENLRKQAKEADDAKVNRNQNLNNDHNESTNNNQNGGINNNTHTTSGSSILHTHGIASSLQTYEYDLPNNITSLESYGDGGGGGTCAVVKIHQRIKIEHDDHRRNGSRDGDGDNDINIHGETLADGDPSSINNSTSNNNSNSNDHHHHHQNEIIHVDIWALIEYEIYVQEETTANTANTPNSPFATPSIRFSRWRRFSTESEFFDHIRRDSGEPITVPPYSLSPKQSKQIEEESRQAVTHVTEEFRRFRVRAEVARKQADATVRALQNNNVQNAQKHIEGQDIASELAQARTDHQQLTALKAEMAEQEAHWKSAYDVLLAENNQLKSSGSEALLAAQWRQRYESCQAEKEKLETALALEKEKSGNSLLVRKKEDSGKYEAKYKDLKESFRLYRKKAKEIFEAQQKGETTMLNLVDNAADEAKISYLRNLMVNYLSSDPTVREHMEGAIGTVLKFSREDFAKISKQKKTNDSSASWFSK